MDALLSFEERVSTVARMCELGHADRMVLSHDAACHNDWFDDEVVAAVQPNWRYTHISDDVIPALRRIPQALEQTYAQMRAAVGSAIEAGNG